MSLNCTPNGRAGSTVALKISADSLADTVRQLLEEYGEDAMDALNESLDEVSKEAVSRLKKASRSAVNGTGEYAKGWTKTVIKGRLASSATVHGKKPTYSLAHLLEHGHATRNGTGRVFQDTPGHEHVDPVNEWAQREIVDRTLSKLEDL